eukprot:442256-Hanusia_phi.AAC.1
MSDRGLHGGKINRTISYPAVLDMRPPRRHSNNSIYDLYGVRLTSRDEAVGKLIAEQVLVHEGSSLQFGHYFSYVKHACKHKEGSWYRMDDSYKSKVDLETALKQNAYILFYARRYPRTESLVQNDSEEDEDSLSEDEGLARVQVDCERRNGHPTDHQVDLDLTSTPCAVLNSLQVNHAHNKEKSIPSASHHNGLTRTVACHYSSHCGMTCSPSPVAHRRLFSQAVPPIPLATSGGRHSGGSSLSDIAANYDQEAEENGSRQGRREERSLRDFLSDRSLANLQGESFKMFEQYVQSCFDPSSAPAGQRLLLAPSSERAFSIDPRDELEATKWKDSVKQILRQAPEEPSDSSSLFNRAARLMAAESRGDMMEATARAFKSWTLAKRKDRWQDDEVSGERESSARKRERRESENERSELESSNDCTALLPAAMFGETEAGSTRENHVRSAKQGKSTSEKRAGNLRQAREKS